MSAPAARPRAGEAAADMPRRPWLLAAASGAAMALALPGPALVPLVLVVPGLLRRALSGARGWRAFRIGWLAGFAQWAIAVAWVYIVLHRYGHLHAALSVVAVVLMSGILGLTWAIAGWATSRLPEGWRVVALPLALAAFEELQRFPPWIFPWNPAVAALTPVPALLAPAPVTGAIGLSLLVYLVGSALDALLDRRLRPTGAVVLLGALVAWGGAAALAPGFRATGAPVKVAAIQPNVPLETRWDPANEQAIEARVWRLSREAADRGARWIVWPESSVPRILERDGEYVPLAGRFAALRALVREVGSFTPGTSLLPLPGPAGLAGVAVCYEVAYPSLYAGEVARGAQVLATITNDGWYGDSAAPRQHLALAILRAAEARRYLVRAANTGISAVIGPDGRVSSRLGVGREGLITAEVRASDSVTPAVRFSGAIRAGVVVVALGVMILGARRRKVPD